MDCASGRGCGHLFYQEVLPEGSALCTPPPDRRRAAIPARHSSKRATLGRYPSCPKFRCPAPFCSTTTSSSTLASYWFRSKYREPFSDDVRAYRIMSSALSHTVRCENIISIDSSCSSTVSDVLTRPPESASVVIEPDEPVQPRVFVDRSVVEMFVQGRQCVAVRVYPSLRDSTGISLLSRSQESELLALDCWQMKNIYEQAGFR